MTTTINNPTQFADEVLAGLGIDASKIDVSNIVRWEQYEGGNWNNTAKYNPLNTTQAEPGSVSFDPNASNPNVQAYVDWQQGVDATVATLENGNYGNIIDALKTNQDYPSFAAAVNTSPWGSHLSGADQGLTGIYQGINSAEQSQKELTKSSSPTNLGGFAGILQGMQSLYDPTAPGLIASITSLGTDNVKEVATLIFVRATSSILFTAVIAIGINTVLHGGSTGGGNGLLGGRGSGGNVIEFINNAQLQNKKLGLSNERIEAARKKEEDVAARHEQRLADKERDRQTRERVAKTPRISHQFRHSTIEHKSQKQKVKVKLVDLGSYQKGK